MTQVATQKELAATLGKSPRTITKWKKRSDWKFGARGPWDVDAIRAWMIRTLQPDRNAYQAAVATLEEQVASGTTGLEGMALAELRLKVERGRKEKVAADRAEGKVHDVAECQKRRLAQIHEAKRALLGLPREAAARCANRNEQEIEDALNEMVETILNDFSHAP